MGLLYDEWVNNKVGFAKPKNCNNTNTILAVSVSENLRPITGRKTFNISRNTNRANNSRKIDNDSKIGERY